MPGTYHKLPLSPSARNYFYCSVLVGFRNRLECN